MDGRPQPLANLLGPREEARAFRPQDILRIVGWDPARDPEDKRFDKGWRRHDGNDPRPFCVRPRQELNPTHFTKLVASYSS